MRFKQVVEKIYVVAVSVGLVLALEHWFRGADAADPLLAAQNSRIRFQVGGETSPTYTNLSPNEVLLAESVLDKAHMSDGKSTELLYVGNSQTLAIMDQVPGDMISAQWLQVLLTRQNDLRPLHDGCRPVKVSLGSLPNITTPELLVRLVAAGEGSPRQVDIFIAGVVLEELRGLGIRNDVVEAASAEKVKNRLRSLVERSGDLPTVHTSLEPLLGVEASQAATLTADAAHHSSLARRLEQKLQQSIEKIPLFAHRDDLRVRVSLGFHESRNHLLGITSSSRRPVPESSYRASLEMIELALRYAESQHIKVVLYLAPMRPIEPNPNVPSDVAKFRRDMPALCSRYGAKCLDYVDLVPENLWTNYPDNEAGSEGQRDFAHFTGAAHKLLAEKLMADMADQLGSVSQSK